MESKISKNIDGSWNLSEVNNMKDLENEIALLKARANAGFDQIKADTTQLPKQAFNSTVGKAIPFLSTDKNNNSSSSGNSVLSFINPSTIGVATTVFSTVRSLFGRKRKRSSKQRLAGISKGLATTVALEGAGFLVNVLSRWNERRKARKEIRDLRVKTEVLKLLKEEQNKLS